MRGQLHRHDKILQLAHQFSGIAWFGDDANCAWGLRHDSTVCAITGRSLVGCVERDKNSGGVGKCAEKLDLRRGDSLKPVE